MIFSVDAEHRQLLVFPNEKAALDAFGPDELDAQFAEFWDEGGAPLKVERTGAKQRLFAARVGLHRFVAGTGKRLEDVLARVEALEPNERFRSVDEVGRHLEAARAR